MQHDKENVNLNEETVQNDKHRPQTNKTLTGKTKDFKGGKNENFIKKNGKKSFIDAIRKTVLKAKIEEIEKCIKNSYKP